MTEQRERPEPEPPAGGTPSEQPVGEPAPPATTGVDDLAGLSAEQLREKVREAREEAQRNWQHFLHLAADLDNYKKQAARERQEAVQHTRRQMLHLVLTVVDNLERAIAFAETAARDGGGDSPAAGRAETRFRSVLDGLRMSRREILDQLAALGVRRIDAAGKPFDPGLHEAVSVAAPDAAALPAGTVAGEVQAGYFLHDDVLRPAKVTVVADHASGGIHSHGTREATRETR